MADTITIKYDGKTKDEVMALKEKVKALESDNYQYLNIIQANDLMGCIPTKEN